MKIGYIRVSTNEQHTAQQEIIMEQLGVEKVFIDKCSGKNADRPKLTEMINFIREGDVVIVSAINAFARNTKDLLNLIDEIMKKGSQFKSLKEGIDTTTPTGQFMLTVFAAISQLEREYMRARQQEGIDAKKARGEYRGRQPIEVDKAKFEREYKLWKEDRITARAAMAHLGLKPNTFYRRVQEYEGRTNAPSPK